MSNLMNSRPSLPQGDLRASWADVEVIESAKLMRHASHNGKRAGNER